MQPLIHVETASRVDLEKGSQVASSIFNINMGVIVRPKCDNFKPNVLELQASQPLDLSLFLPRRFNHFPRFAMFKRQGNQE